MSMSHETKDEIILAEKEKPSKTKRPSLSVYVPPGLRSIPAFNSKALKEGDHDQVSVASSDSRSSNQSDQQLPICRTFTSKPLQHSLKSVCKPTFPLNPSTAKQAISKDLIRPQFMHETLSKKKMPFAKKEMDEILSSLHKLSMSKDNELIEQFAAGGMCDESLARRLAQSLVHYAIEENRQSGRKVARLCASILDCPSGPAFHTGFITSLMHYFECREQLRSNHLKVWTGFLNFVSNLYSSVGFTYEGGLVDTIFNIFDYMLKVPVLESIKIEELECLIASFLSVGYDLERHCPDQLVCLKNVIRDAFVEINEPWARKMILLLMELGASGWSLPPEANEYYFQ